MTYVYIMICLFIFPFFCVRDSLIVKVQLMSRVIGLALNTKGKHDWIKYFLRCLYYFLSCPSLSYVYFVWKNRMKIAYSNFVCVCMSGTYNDCICHPNTLLWFKNLCCETRLFHPLLFVDLSVCLYVSVSSKSVRM